MHQKHKITTAITCNKPGLTSSLETEWAYSQRKRQVMKNKQERRKYRS